MLFHNLLFNVTCCDHFSIINVLRNCTSHAAGNQHPPLRIAAGAGFPPGAWLAHIRHGLQRIRSLKWGCRVTDEPPSEWTLRVIFLRAA